MVLVIRAVFFDVDGTLIDSNPLHIAAWVRTLGHFGITATEEEVGRQLGKGGDQLMPAFMTPEQVDRLGPAVEAYRGKLYSEEYLSQARPFPGVRSLFERVRAESCQTILASSGKAAELDHYQKVAAITDLVDAVVSSDNVEHSKPAPDVFQAALKRVSPISAAETVAVGDTPYDAQSARGAGVRTIGVLSGGFSRADLLAAGSVAVYDDVADLLANYARSPLAA